MPLENIPEYLKLSQGERRAAWEKHRLEAKALPPEVKPRRLPLGDIPGAKDEHADDTDA